MAEKTNSLFTPKHRGGVIGGSGYNFQDAYIVMQIPEWIGTPGFHSFLKEGFDDIDVRFDQGETSEFWHYQLKNHQLGLQELF